MKKKCPNCNLVNFADSVECIRCQCDLSEVSSERRVKKQNASPSSKFLRRAAVFVFVSFAAILGFYLSMIFTSEPLKFEEKQTVEKAVALLGERGFSREAFLLGTLTSFRANDHWLNASVEKESAYAATNFPFEIITVYPDFFLYPADDVERAAVLLHEAKHLEGKDERDAYKFVWQNRQKLGWTKNTHGRSAVWQHVRKQTREFAPELFVCEFKDFGDCTE